MANINLVNIGTNPNDNTGDPIRTAYDKINTSITNINNEIAGLPVQWETYTDTEVSNSLSTVSSLYLTQANAASTYLTQANAASTYVRLDEMINFNVREITANHSILPTENGTFFAVDANTGNITITLPLISDVGEPFVTRVKKIDNSSNTVTVTTNGSDTIDGSVNDVEYTVQDTGGLFSADIDTTPDNWVSAGASGSGGGATAADFFYTLSGGQTVITGPDDNGVTLSYVAGAEEVFLDGVKLIAGVDYTRTDGNTITLTSPAIAGQELDIRAYGTFTVADTYTKAEIDNKDATKVAKSGDTMTGALVLSGDPTSNLEAATKQYVDSATSVLSAHFLHVQDQKPSGTSGGTFTAGAWQTRDLNTVLTNEIAGSSLSSNQITLPIGTYYIEASAPVYSVDNHKVKVRDITGSADLLIGTSEFQNDNDNAHGRSFVSGRFTLSVQSDIELQHRSALTFATNGFGVASGFSVVEVYADVKIWRVS